MAAAAAPRLRLAQCHGNRTAEGDRTLAWDADVHGDHLGGLNVLTNSAGIEVQRLTYLPFGETSANTGTVDFDQERYTGCRTRILSLDNS